jgi:tRNA-2-methylthio-N6-dimethylallyladenosine synthase
MELIKDILVEEKSLMESPEEVGISMESNNGKSKKLYIESYGCQMNFSDSEIVTSILEKDGFDPTPDINMADLILLNTCSIREKAEKTVRNRLNHFKNLKTKNPALQIGLLGCMAERLKKKLLEEEKIVDLIAGPDSYRDLPNLLKNLDDGRKAVNVILSREETYADISPFRLQTNGVTAFISIMRGCDNMCSFCVVPFTRGRERSRDPGSIVKEARELFSKGFREVTLLGQNVDSYKWSMNSEENGAAIVNFASLLEEVAQISPELRIRFSTSHPKDITDQVLETIARYENICNYIHLPVQSGSDRILKLMNRTYDREWYLARIKSIRRIIGEDCGISSDMISGFCSESESEHEETLSLMKEVEFDFSYMFHYSERPGTLAAKKFKDDIQLETKKKRLEEIIELQKDHSEKRNKKDIGKRFKVLVEGRSKRSDEHLFGRNSQNKVVVFPKEGEKPGDYVWVKIENCTSATLTGIISD